MINPTLIYLAVLIFGMNVVPAFMPPTWTVLAFFYLTFRLPLVPLVFVGAAAATLGRIVLAEVARSHFRPRLAKEAKENYETLGRIFHAHHHITLPLLFLYAFFPWPSNHIYIIAGLANADITIIATSFFLGRLVSYTFWVTAAHFFVRRLSDIFAGNLTPQALVVELLGIVVIVLAGKIQWHKIFDRHLRHSSSFRFW